MSEFPRNNSEFVEEQGYDSGGDYYDGDSDYLKNMAMGRKSLLIMIICGLRI